MAVLAAALLLVAVVLAVLLWRSRQQEHALAAAIEGALRTTGTRSSGQDPTAELTAALRSQQQGTERAKASARQAEAALAAADYGIVIIAHDGSISFSNPAADRYWQARHGDAVAELRMREMVKQVTTERRAVRRQLEVYTPSHRRLELHALPIGTRREERGAVIFVEDLTDRFRVDAIRRDFVTNASHELKTPLGALTVLAETLASTDDPDVRARLTARLESEARRMSRLVDDILDLALLEGNPDPLTPLAVDDILDAAERQVWIVADHHGIDIRRTRAGDDVLIAGDRRQLVAAIASLLENAIKYTDILEPGVGGMVWLRGSADAATATIAVEDRGIGITPDHQQRIFERFYRVDAARSRDTGGTGLGLAIAHHVALNHESTIEVESTPGVGSTFSLTLPRWEP